MSEQRHHVDLPDAARQRTGGDHPAVSAERLAATGAELDLLFTAADAILDRIRMSDSMRLLEHARQRGGQ